MRRISIAHSLFLLIWPLMLSIEAWGHGYESMARPNFETVGLGISVDDECPLDDVAARAAAKAEFLRARIKTSDLMLLSNGGFWLSAACIDKGDSSTYLYRVRLEWTWEQGEEWPLTVLSENFGQRGDGADGLEEIIGHVVERGLTAYLEANLE